MKPAIVFSVPITEMAAEHAGTDKAKNIVVTGLLAGWFGIGRESMLAGIRKKFAKKGAPWWKETCARSRRDWISPRPIRSRKTASWRLRNPAARPSC